MKKHVESLKPADERIPDEDVIISRMEVEDLPSVHIKEDNPLEERDIKISIREDIDEDDIRITVKDDSDGSDDSESKSETEPEEIPQYKFPTF